MDGNNDLILRVERLSVNRAGRSVLKDISLNIKKGDHLAVIGGSGSGKTTFGLALSGQIFYKGEIKFAPAFQQNIIWVEQQHHFKNLSNTTDLYYQQRFNSYDSEQTQTVEGALYEFGNGLKMILKIMKIEYLEKKPLIQLSNGENKKLQIAKALLSGPDVLIMDQPFIGLDTETRTHLHSLINKLASQGILIILITTPDEIPECITKILFLEGGKVNAIESRHDFDKNFSLQKRAVAGRKKEELLKIVSGFTKENFNCAIRMRNVNVKYGEKQILQQINWEVLKGERWLLSGPNGAGKSTLLSLVTADNPQAYANEIYLFDKKRGSGESIWDIKNKIGYLSPELHLFFDHGCTCFEAVASGLFDTIGLFRKLTDTDIQTVYRWMSAMEIEGLQHKRLFDLSAGEQRLVLLVRALVKNPPMLILDEPCQGLDKDKETELLELIDMVCLQGDKTMVFVTHNQNKKPACINHFIKLDAGKVKEAGSFIQ